LRTKKGNEHELILEGSFAEAVSSGTDNDPLEDTVTTGDYSDARWSPEDNFRSGWHTVGILLVVVVFFPHEGLFLLYLIRLYTSYI
jgi:hypothetical protein